MGARSERPCPFEPQVDGKAVLPVRVCIKAPDGEVLVGASRPPFKSGPLAMSYPGTSTTESTRTKGQTPTSTRIEATGQLPRTAQSAPVIVSTDDSPITSGTSRPPIRFVHPLEGREACRSGGGRGVRMVGGTGLGIRATLSLRARSVAPLQHRAPLSSGRTSSVPSLAPHACRGRARHYPRSKRGQRQEAQARSLSDRDAHREAW